MYEPITLTQEQIDILYKDQIAGMSTGPMSG
jgi:hypothetical protein